MATCPVCGIEVEEKKARGTSAFNDKTYYFCTKACKRVFDESPADFSKKEEGKHGKG